MRTPEGRQTLLELVSRVDVLVESFRAGTLAKMGLDEARMQQRPAQFAAHRPGSDRWVRMRVAPVMTSIFWPGLGCWACLVPQGSRRRHPVCKWAILPVVPCPV